MGIFLGKAKLGQWSVAVDLPSVLTNGEKSQVVFSYGKFLQAGLDFLILALVVFFIVKAFARLKEKAEDPQNKEVPTPKDIQLLGEIRDLLAQPKN